MLLASWTLHLHSLMQEGLKQRSLMATQEFYAPGAEMFAGQEFRIEALLRHLDIYRLKLNKEGQLLPGEMKVLTGVDCREQWPEHAPSALHCLEIVFTASPFANEQHWLAIWQEPDRIARWLHVDNGNLATNFSLPPLRFAQFQANQAILRRELPLSHYPAICLEAVLAIEDPQFLEHQGFSLRSILRAIFKNLQAGRKAQGGSTITQQLVKNYFLSHQKTYSRKIKELLLAILIELRWSKDEILAAYLNEIYMGQNGVFEVRGFAAAAEHYFAKQLESLNAAECSLLAAILNSPGSYNPFRYPERAKARRDLVLQKLRDSKVLSKTELTRWQSYSLVSARELQHLDPAPYYLDAVKEELKSLGLAEQKNLKILTGLHLEAQSAATKIISEGIIRLEKNNKSIQKWRKEGKELQGVLISADPRTGLVRALVGGRSYKSSPYNRALLAKRQIGSLMKPFVYLSAMENPGALGYRLQPLTELSDTPFSYPYEGQEWQPRNYDNKFRGTVPAYYALKNSLNIPTARLAIASGLENLVDLSYRLGVSSPLTALPSLSLGAFELRPIEVLQSFTSLAALGTYRPLHFVLRVEDSEGRLLYSHQPQQEQRVAAEWASILVGMMKTSLQSGTARGVRAKGFLAPAAGKTGTTSDYHDAWFAGFTPNHSSIVWLGYDDNSSHKLTGASGAVPLWTDYMRAVQVFFPLTDFAWPESVETVNIRPASVIANPLLHDELAEQKDLELVFLKGQGPK